MTREEQLAAGLAQLHKDVAHMTRQITQIQQLVPVLDFGAMIDSAEEADERQFEALTAAPPEHVARPHQLPMFDYEPPITIIFENVTINGEVVDMNEMESIDGSDS